MQDMAGVLNRLKKRSYSESSTVLAIEYNWDHVLKEVHDFLSQLGFAYFSYSVATCKLPNAEFDTPFYFNHNSMVGSVPKEVIEAYQEQIAQQDPSLDRLIETKQPLIVSASSVSSCSVADAFWEKQGIHSRCYIPMNSRNADYWFHYFTLYHVNPADELTGFFESAGKWLIPALGRYHKMLQILTEQEQNPFLYRDILSPTCFQVLRMTAKGMPVKSIADRLKLTEEGITYHITRAKRLFGARNKTHLIAILYEVGLL